MNTVIFNPGDVVFHEGSYGIIIDNVQQAWGANRFKVMLANGTIKYIWDKHMRHSRKR